MSGKGAMAAWMVIGAVLTVGGVWALSQWPDQWALTIPALTLATLGVALAGAGWAGLIYDDGPVKKH